MLRQAPVELNGFHKKGLELSTRGTQI